MRRLTDDAAQDIVPRWSPDGQWIAFLSDRGGKYEIWKMRPDGTGITQMTDEPGREVIAPVWSPDSRQLLYEIRNVNAYVIDADRVGAEQKPRPLPAQQPPSFIPWDWSPDGQYLVGWQHSVEWGIVVYSFPDRRYQRLTKIGSFPVWLNDSRHLIFREDGELYFLDRLGGEPRKTLSLKGSAVGTHLLSRDGRRLYFSSASNEADLWLLKLK
ncbi:MAG TPA: hypothetical protein VKB46_28630 [Pyrinomonadaceae bacterium]|nr:hypothetical protein [Pyrinomonadaceae bacterium]